MRTYTHTQVKHGILDSSCNEVVFTEKRVVTKLKKKRKITSVVLKLDRCDTGVVKAVVMSTSTYRERSRQILFLQ
jgi:hypothetical protein